MLQKLKTKICQVDDKRIFSFAKYSWVFRYTECKRNFIFLFYFFGRELILQLICWLGTIFLRVFHFGEISEWQHLWTKKRKWNCNPEMHISNILQRMGGGTGWEEGTRSNMEFADDSFFIIHWNWKCLCDLRCLLQFVTSRLFQRTKASEDPAPLVQNKNW